MNYKTRDMVKSVFIAGLGGFIGTVTRFLISRYFQINCVSAFPWGTLTVNVLGCLLLGIFFGISERGNFLTPEWRLFLTVGFCGGFTTFSSLSNDAVMLLQSKEFFRFATYAGLSFFLGLAAVYTGRLIIKII